MAKERVDPSEPALPLPDFVVVGAMRSGTTSLARYLGAHPQICMATTKEVHFFDHNYEKGVGWYSQNFDPSPAHKRLGEATPGYLFHPKVPHRMAKVIPGSKLIALLRNPVDRAYSHYWQKRSYGTEPLSFEAAIEAEPERLSMGERPRILYSYLSQGRYLEQLTNFVGPFKKERVGVFLFEDLRSDPVTTFHRICQFIGVSDQPQPTVLGRPMHSYQEYRFPSLRAVTKRLPGPLKKLFGRLNARAAVYPPMPPSLRMRLMETFEEPNRALAEWAALDLSVWGSEHDP